MWKAVIYARTGAQQSGCPVCAGKTRRKTKQTQPAETSKR